MLTKSQYLSRPALAVPHAFSTKQGGVSEGVYAGLNLGYSTGDARAKVDENRRRLLEAFGVNDAQVCALEQVHSNLVVAAEPGWHSVQADASVTANPDLLLVIGIADCLPVLFHDPVKNVVGAAHAGWRGTAGHISANVVGELESLYSSNPADLRVVMGPGIRGDCYQVGAEVVEQFIENGFPRSVYPPDDEGRWRLDIAAANRYSLEQAGVKPDNIHLLGDCTHCVPEQFYSHRRDGRQRGSHWAVIKLQN